MYDPDALEIQDFARQSPQNLFRVGLFVLSTINRYLEMVPAAMQDWDINGMESRLFTGQNKRAIAALAHEATQLHQNLEYDWLKTPTGNTEYRTIRTFIELPGFGITKAAFFAQLILPAGRVGCLDRHNLRRFGLNEKLFVRTPAGTESLTDRIEAYLLLCEQFGGSEALWDGWCRHVALLRPHVFKNADSVSKLHVKCVLGDDPT